MISENLANLFSNLKKDNVPYFISNWSTVMNNKDIKENFLSYCIEENAFKVFEYAINKGLSQIRSIIVANAIRNDNKKILSLMQTHELFDFNDQKATDLLSISVSNNDTKVIDFLIDKVNIAKDILIYALPAHNKELLSRLSEKNFDWDYQYTEQNPVVFIMENYRNEKSEFIHHILAHTKYKDKIINEAFDYLKDTSKAGELKNILQ